MSETAQRIHQEYSKAYCGHDPELIEDDVFRLVLPLSEKTSEETPVETSEKTSEKILAAVRKNRVVTIAELAHSIGVTPRSIERNIKNLQQKGRLRRVGPDKGCHWEVLP